MVPGDTSPGTFYGFGKENFVDTKKWLKIDGKELKPASGTSPEHSLPLWGTLFSD